MDVVDAQVHLNQLGTDWRNSPPDALVETAVLMMDAVGVSALLIDEAAGFDARHRHLPAYELPNGAIRSMYPVAERAVARYPERFGIIARVDPDDPDLDAVMAGVRQMRGGQCVRLVPQPDNGEFAQLERGGFASLFAAAERHGVPIFAWLPGRTHALESYLRTYPGVSVFVDHIGVGGGASGQNDERNQQFERVLALARYQNFGLKWCHAPQRFSTQPYPFADVEPFLRRALDAFGPERLMWASDHTQSKTHYSWAEALYCVRDSAALSPREKEWLLGRTARTVLRWPAPGSQ